MVLRLLSVQSAGDAENERVVLRAPIDLALGKYIILRARTAPDEKVFSGAIPAAFWFDTFSVKGNDLVILYTKAGQRSSKTGEDLITSHFFYWGLTGPQWNEGHKPTVIWASGWDWTPKP